VNGTGSHPGGKSLIDDPLGKLPVGHAKSVAETPRETPGARILIVRTPPTSPRRESL